MTTRRMKWVLATIVVAVVAVLALIGLATGFVELLLWVSGAFGLHHALGMDTQASENYASASGVLPMIVAALGFSGILVTAWRRWNCHETGCLRHGKYEIEGGVRCCDEHHPALDKRPHDKRGAVHRIHVGHLKHLHRYEQQLSEARQ